MSRGAFERSWRERREQAAEDIRKMKERLGLAAPEEEEMDEFELWTVPVRGFRNFDLSFGYDDKTRQKYGWLTGCYHKEPWDIGVNTAKCMSFGVNLTWDWDRNHWVGLTGEAHSLEGCNCGFYAVFDPSKTGYGSLPISGMIEGWGEVILGPHGFRAQKAKIVALCLPPLPHPDKVRATIQGQRVLIGKEYAKPLGIVDEGPHPRLPDEYNCGLRQAYKGVPVFNNTRQMFEAFPIDRGEVPVEEEKPSLSEVQQRAIRWISSAATAYGRPSNMVGGGGGVSASAHTHGVVPSGTTRCANCGDTYGPGEYHSCTVIRGMP
jgi:hypothetical protein